MRLASILKVAGPVLGGVGALLAAGATLYKTSVDAQLARRGADVSYRAVNERLVAVEARLDVLFEVLKVGVAPAAVAASSESLATSTRPAIPPPSADVAAPVPAATPATAGSRRPLGHPRPLRHGAARAGAAAARATPRIPPVAAPPPSPTRVTDPTTDPIGPLLERATARRKGGSPRDLDTLLQNF